MRQSIIVFSTFLCLNALADFNLKSAKDFAYKRPLLLNAAVIESLTYKCNHYLNFEESVVKLNRYFPQCLSAAKKLTEILDVKSYEVEKDYFLPISFSTKLLEMSKDKNVLIFLDFFNKNIIDNKIKELKHYISTLFNGKYTFEEFIAVLFQDTALSHIDFLREKIDPAALLVIEQSNKKFFEALTEEREIKELYSYPVETSNPYHFYVIRYLAQKLAPDVGYQMAAFTAFMFNYSYELLEIDHNPSHLHHDPRKIQDPSTVEDIKLGFLGAYFKDDFSDRIDIIGNSIQNATDFFIHDVSKKIK